MKEHSNFPIHLCMHCAHMKVLICKEQHIKLPDFNDILAPVLWHQIGALCSLNTARFIHANLIYAATCANLSVIFPCRLAKTFGSTSEATCQEQPSREDVVLHFLPIPLLCSRNQFTGAIFAKAWPYKNGWMKRHEYIRMNWYCRHASFEQPNWEHEPFRVNVRGDRVRAALRPSALSLEPSQTAKSCFIAFR